MWSPVMEFMDEDEGIDENQALRDVMKIKEWNRLISKDVTNATQI
jgi:hypothetical protein